MTRLSHLMFRLLSFRQLPWVLLAVGIAVSVWLAWPLLYNPDDADATRYGVRMLVVGSTMALLLSLAVRALRDQVAASQRALRSAQLDHHNSEDNMRAVFDASVDAIIIINSAGIVQMLNAAAERLFGYGASEVLGNNVNMLMPSPYRELHDNYLRHYMAGGEARIIGTGREVEGLRKDGSVFPMRLAVSEVKIDGRASRFVGIVHDVTEQKRTETMLWRHTEELEQLVNERTVELRATRDAAEAANRTKSAFFASMSHELRTPLHAILSFSGLGLEKLQGSSPEQQRQYLEKISVAGQRMLNLINDLLDISKLESGKMTFSFAPHDLYQIATEMATELHAVADAKRIVLEVEPPTFSVSVVCDAHRIGQVLRNLLANAIRFSPEHEPIKVIFTATTYGATDGGKGGEVRSAVVVSVLDHGQGVPPAEMETIFDAYAQSPAHVAQSKGGTGLGLMICRQIIEAHRGHIWAEENVDGGARLNFSLPRMTAVEGGL